MAAAKANEQTQERLRGNLNPKQAAYARRAAGDAAKRLQQAEAAWLAHLQKHHPADHRQFLAQRAQADAAAQEAERRRVADDQARAEAERLAAERATGTSSGIGSDTGTAVEVVTSVR